MRRARASAPSHSVWRRFRISRVGVAVAVIAFLVLGGTGAFAYWATSTVPVTTTASSGTLKIAAQWSASPSLGATFTNVNPQKATGQFTVTNSTATSASLPSNTTPMSYTVTLGYDLSSPAGDGAGPLATDLSVYAWKKTTNCSTLPNPLPTPGTWTAPPTVTGSLVPGATDTWCVYTTVAERSKLASTNGKVSLVPKLTATLSTGNWTSAAAVSKAPDQKTQFIYPAFAPSSGWFRIFSSVSGHECMDVRSAGGNGANIIAWQCKPSGNSNQQWKFTVTDTGYLKITPRHDTSLFVGVAGASTTAGSLVQAQTSTVTDGSQEWQLQKKRAGVYQLVNRKSGLCMEPDIPDAANDYPMRQQVCSDLALQEFTLNPWENPAFETFTCTNNGSGNPRGFTLNWTKALADDVTIQVRPDAGSPWMTNGTATLGATGYAIGDLNTLKNWDYGVVHQYQVVGAQGTQLATGNFRTGHDNGFFGWGAYDYLRCGS